MTIEGHRNTGIIRQDFNSGLGGENQADVTMLGNANYVEVEQFGDNVAFLRIEGDGNNTAGGLSAGPRADGLVAGVLSQTGIDNDFSGTMTGNNNVVGAIQLGDLNAILLTVAGDDNEAAFYQVGRDNTAALRQIGSGNRAFFRQ
jgi:hypothetical protein